MHPRNRHSIVIQETHYYPGDQTVASAAQAMSELPNGWKLISFEFEKMEIVEGFWKAVVEGPKESKKL